MTELRVETVLDGDGASVAGLSVRGELDHDSAEEFLEAFRSALPTLSVSGGSLLMDCADVVSCDYAGLSALLMARREAGRRGARLVLLRQSPPLAALLSVAGVSDLLSEGETMAAEDGADGDGLSEDLGTLDEAPGPDLGDRIPAGKRAEAAVRRIGTVPVVTLAGELDLDAVEEITAAFAEARASEGDGRIVVDLSGLEFADSTTLHVLLQARAGSELWLVGPLRPQLRLLFQVTDLLDAFRFTDSLDEALETLDRAL